MGKGKGKGKGNAKAREDNEIIFDENFPPLCYLFVCLVCLVCLSEGDAKDVILPCMKLFFGLVC
jgi:hypothetical protein